MPINGLHLRKIIEITSIKIVLFPEDGNFIFLSSDMDAVQTTNCVGMIPMLWSKTVKGENTSSNAKASLMRIQVFK